MQTLVQKRRELGKEHIAVMHLVYVKNCPGCEYREQYEKDMAELDKKIQFIFIQIPDDRS